MQNFDQLNTALERLNRYNRDVARFSDDLYNILNSGYLVRSFQVEELAADKIVSGIIAVDQIYLYDNKFELNGALQQIIVKDDQPTPKVRVEIGKFGSGSDYGIKIRNTAGTVVFQATSSVFIDGGIINNATITGAKLQNATIGTANLQDFIITTAKLAAQAVLSGNIGNGAVGTTQIANAAVGNAQIANLSASKITVAGTLTCSSTTTAINVTSSGVVLFSGGGDITMRASAASSNFITFQNSSSVTKGQIAYLSFQGRMDITSQEKMYVGTSADLGYFYGYTASFNSIYGNCVLEQQFTNSYLALFSSGINVLNADGGASYTIGDWLPNSNNAYDSGDSTHKWANTWTVVQHTGDILFPNGFCLTEADKVYQGLSGETGQFLLGPDKKPRCLFANDGNTYIAGHVVPNVNFDNMFNQYAPIDFNERHEVLKQEKLAIRKEERKRTKAEAAKRIEKYGVKGVPRGREG